MSGLPAEVQGQSTTALANTPITVVDIGFAVNHTAHAVQIVDSYFGTVDHSTPAPGSAPQPNSPYLRALFQNSALTLFAFG